MKVRKQRLNHLELKTRLAEEIGLAAGRDDCSAIPAGYMLKGSDARRSHSDDAAAFILRSSDGQGGLGRDFIPLRIHPMLFQPLHPHRAKRSRSDVKSDFDRLDAARPKSFKDTCGKVQPCGGCGDGTSHFGIDRLISLAISGVIGAMKVRRQWNVAKVLNGLFDSPLASRQTDSAKAIFASIQHLCLQSAPAE